MKIHSARLTNPDRTEIRDSKTKWLATMTQGAYTVALSGPRRTFAVPAAADTVSHSVWIRTLQKPYDKKSDTTWLMQALQQQHEENSRRACNCDAIHLESICNFRRRLADRRRCRVRTFDRWQTRG